ncbi:Spc97/Spc98 family protein, partial [Xylariaceae sp. FL0255]
MLHEILLSLSGHPSPLLRNDHSDPTASVLIPPSERQILSTAAKLSDLHCKLRAASKQISQTHPSIICRAVFTAILSIHLSAFQRKILEVEEIILSKDAALVGAYNIVPLTAVIGEFSGWTRRLEWLWTLVQFLDAEKDGSPCQAAQLIDKLRGELQTGYSDVAETAQSLLHVAETSWLKQTAAWVLYGHIPLVGESDFFISRDEESEQGYKLNNHLLPSFLTQSTADSMLFIGLSINRARSRSSVDLDPDSLNHLASQHRELAKISYPINSAVFSRTITNIRSMLSRTVLLKLLPLEKVLEILTVLREFFLIGRGEFAMALTQEADAKIRSRWRRADNLAYEKRGALSTVVVKEGEVAAVLARTWAALGSMQGQHSEEDETLELARELLRLNVIKSNQLATSTKGPDGAPDIVLDAIASTPFQNLLFSVPVTLTLQIPSPLDLFLTHSDLQIYTSINSYLLSIRRAHLRLTDLWKITSLRRHHPPPPRAPYGNTKGGIARTRLLRDRWSLRSSTMRGPWSTSSAAIFFLAETEAYLQVEVVEGLWSGFYSWLTDDNKRRDQSRPSTSSNTISKPVTNFSNDKSVNDSNFPPNASSPSTSQPQPPPHDPQSLSVAHRQYLSALTRRLLLTCSSFTAPLYDLLVHIDHLIALVQRLQNVWTSLDLETDEGVVDAFANLETEERDVRAQLRGVERSVKEGVECVVDALRALSMDPGFAEEMEGVDVYGEVGEGDDVGEWNEEEGQRKYRPRRVGGIERLLMKLDFGSWFGGGLVGGLGTD